MRLFKKRSRSEKFKTCKISKRQKKNDSEKVQKNHKENFKIVLFLKNSFGKQAESGLSLKWKLTKILVKDVLNLQLLQLQICITILFAFLETLIIINIYKICVYFSSLYNSFQSTKKTFRLWWHEETWVVSREGAPTVCSF